jgi:hypothetical protein
MKIRRGMHVEDFAMCNKLQVRGHKHAEEMVEHVVEKEVES